MPIKNTFSFHFQTTLDVAAENVFSARQQLFEGLNKINDHFGIYEFEISLEKICGETGQVLFDSNFDCEDPDQEIEDLMF
jgi:hypothetical protein